MMDPARLSDWTLAFLNLMSHRTELSAMMRRSFSYDWLPAACSRNETRLPRCGVTMGISCARGSRRRQRADLSKRTREIEWTHGEGDVLDELEDALGRRLVAGLEGCLEDLDDARDEVLERGLRARARVSDRPSSRKRLEGTGRRTISWSSPDSTNSASLPRDRIDHTRTARLSGSASVLLKSWRSAGIWFWALPPGWLGAMAIESRSMKMVWSATSRWAAVVALAVFHSQGRSSVQTPFSSSNLAMADTRRAEAVRA